MKQNFTLKDIVRDADVSRFITKTVMDDYKIDYKLIISPVQKREVVAARDTIALLIKEYTKTFTLRLIGEAIGRDHSSAFVCVNKAKNSFNPIINHKTEMFRRRIEKFIINHNPNPF